MSRTQPDVSVGGGSIDVAPPPLPETFDTTIQPQPGPKPARTIRHAHLYLTRLDPWSVMKNAFMLSIAIAVVIVVATMILWGMLTLSGTLAALTRTVDDIAGSGANAIDLTGLLSFGRILTISTAIALIEVVLVSALATLFAYLYNLAVGITGGLQVTLTEDN